MHLIDLLPRVQHVDNAPELPGGRFHPRRPRPARWKNSPKLEKFPPNNWVRSTAPIYAQAYHEGQVYHGEKPGGNKFIALDVNVIQGGNIASTKMELIKRATDAIEEYGDLPKGEPRRVYVIIWEVVEANLGFDGKSVDLEVLLLAIAWLTGT